MRHKEPWYESDNPSRVIRGGTWRAGLWLLVVVAILGVIGGVVWAVKVALAPVKGAGDVYRKQQDANNRIFAQEHFQQLYNQIVAYDRQLDQAAADKAEHKGSDFYATNYSGLVKICLDAVGQYDADANKITQAQWRDTTLPYQIDTTDPATDCKEKDAK